MAAIGALESLCQALPEAIRRQMIAYTREWATSLRFGVPSTVAVRAENMGGALVPFTTSAVANNEVAIAHGLGRIPRVMWKVLALDTVNATDPVLTVTQAADQNFIYVKSATTTASGHLYVEMLIMAVGLSSAWF